MAFVPQQISESEDEKNQFGRTAPTTPQPTPGSGSAGQGGIGGVAPGVATPTQFGVAGQGGIGGVAPGVATPTQFGSNAAKLSDYLKANQPQVAAFGQQIAGKLGSDYSNLTGAIDQGFGNFNQQVSGGYTPPDQSKVSQAASNPSQFASNPQNVQDFQKWYSSGYSGPQDFESSPVYSDLNSQVNNAVQNAGLVGSSAGLGTYLNNNMGGANRTQGMQSLDTALLQKSPEASQAIRDAAAPYKNLSDYLSSTTQKADQSVASAKQNADQSQQSLQNKFTGQGGVIPNFTNQIQNEVGQAKSTAAQRSADATAALKGTDASKISDQTLSDLGIRRDQLDQILKENQFLGGGFPIQNYLTQQSPDTAINAGNVASSDEYANLAALSMLTGQDMSSLFNPNQANLAGTANLNLNSFNPQALTDLQAMYEPAYADYLKKNPGTSGSGRPSGYTSTGSPFMGVY